MLPEKEKAGSEIEYQNQIMFQNTDVNLIYYREKKIGTDGKEKNRVCMDYQYPNN